jgi:hypothetical protein
VAAPGWLYRYPCRAIIDFVSTSPQDNFHLDMTFTGKDRTLLVKRVAVVVAAAGIIFIFATMTTSLAAHLLPMSDQYLQVLVPQAPDGKEPLALKTLDNSTEGNTLSVTGTIQNRTDFPISGLLAVLSAQDVRYNRQTTSAPLTPGDIPSGGTGTFQVSITLPDQPGQYSVEFRIPDGPAVPHHDDRAASYGVPEQPKITIEPKK